MYGRFPIVRDARTGVEMVRTHDGRPLASVNEVGNRSAPATLPPLRTLSLDDFVNAVADRVRAQERAR